MMSLSVRNPNPLARPRPSDSLFHELPIDPTLVDCIEVIRSPYQPRPLLARGSEENTRPVVSMTGGSRAASPAGPSGEGGAAEWRRIYDRVEALLPQVEKLAGDRARLEETIRTQHKLWEARENNFHARLLQAKASRWRWKTAYIELPLLANPKIAELKENDLEDSRKCEALVDVDNSGPEIQVKGARRDADLSETNVGYEDIVRDLRADITKLKQAYETEKLMSANKDKEATEAAQKLQQNIDELLVATQKKDDEIGRLRAEIVDAENKDYTALLKVKEVEGAQATEATNKLLKDVEELQVALAARDKDDEIRILLAEALAAKNKSLIAQHEIQKLKDGQLECLECLKRKRASLSNESSQKRWMNTHVMHFEQRKMRLFVKICGGRTITLKVWRSATIYDVKAKIQYKERIPSCQQRLMFGYVRLLGSETLKDNYIPDESTLTLRLALQGMHIFVQTLTGNTIPFEVERSDTVYNVKAKAYDDGTGIVPVGLRIIFAGKWLEEDRTLADYDIRNNCILVLHLRIMRISVRTPSGRTVIDCRAYVSETVGHLKAKIHAELCIPPEQQRLSWRGELLENDCILEKKIGWSPSKEDKIGPCVLLLQLRLPGGGQ